MHTILLSLVLLFAPPPRQEPNEHLKPLAWLEGSWVGTGKYGEVEIEDRITYVLTHGGHFLQLKAVARMGGQVVQSGSGMIGYDKAKNKLVMHTYFTSGEIGMTESLPSQEKNVWRFAVRIGVKQPWEDARAIMTKVDRDTYTYVVQMKRGDAFVTFFDATYKRKKE